MVVTASPSLLCSRTCGLGGARCGGQARCAFDGFVNADIGAAATEIAGHPGTDLVVARLRRLCQQRGGGHDLAGLAVAALLDVDVLPGDLHRMTAVSRQTLDRGHLLV